MRRMGGSYGTAGGSLTGDAAAWVGDTRLADAGRAGEVAVGSVLDGRCQQTGGATVLHDLRIPGSPANIDHLVISRDRVWLVDAKNWAPGFYWGGVGRGFGRAFRGWKRFVTSDGNAPAEKQTMVMAQERLDRWLKGRGVSCSWLPSTVAVRSSRQGQRVSVWALRGMPGAEVVGLTWFRWLAWWRCRGMADQRVLQALLPLVR